MALAKKLLHTRYRVNDLEQTVEFYKNVLGLEEVRRHKSPRGSELAFLKAPESEETVEIASPMVGTFYRAPTPDADPFVNVGDRVAPDQVVCIIEAMKVMNEIKAEAEGEVVRVLVENGESVEYGQPLMVIRARHN